MKGAPPKPLSTSKMSGGTVDPAQASSSDGVVWRKRYLKFADPGIVICLCLLVAVLPIAHTTSIRDFAIITALVLWIGILWLERRWPGRQNPLNLPILLFSIAAVSSILFSWNLEETIDDIRGELIKVFLLYYLVADRIRRADRAKILLLVFFGLSAFLSLYSIWDFTQHGGKLRELTYRAGALRDPGGGEVAGLIHCMVLAFLVPSLNWWRQPMYRTMLGVAILLNVAGLYLTFTRAAWLAFLTQCVFLALTAPWQKWSKTAVISTLIIGVLILPAGILYHGERELGIKTTLKLFLSSDPETIERELGGTGGHRLGSLKLAWETIGAEPFIPHGWGLYLGKSEVNGLKTKNWRYIDPTNSFVAIAYQTGVQGLLLFLYLLYKVWQLNWRKFKELSPQFAKWFYLGNLTMVVGFCINIFFGTFYKDESALLFWLLIGMAVGLIPQEASDDAS